MGAQAAAIIQGLLEHQIKNCMLDANPVAMANQLVAHMWAQNPNLFEGKTGPKPHKTAVAAVSLANGLDLHRDTEALQISCMFALGQILEEIEVNGYRYPFRHVDHHLIDASVKAFTEKAEEMEQHQSVFDTLGL